MTTQQPQQPRRVRKRSTAAPEPEPVLHPGDKIGYGMTVEVKHHRKGSFWPRIEVTTEVQEGETARQAVNRAGAFVTKTLDEVVLSILSED